MMSGPHGGAEPPAIVIAWSSADNAWRATLIVSADAEATDIAGPSSSHASTPAGALDELLGRRLGCLSDGDMPATLVSIHQLVDQLPACLRSMVA